MTHFFRNQATWLLCLHTTIRIAVLISRIRCPNTISKKSDRLIIWLFKTLLITDKMIRCKNKFNLKSLLANRVNYKKDRTLNSFHNRLMNTIVQGVKIKVQIQGLKLVWVMQYKRVSLISNSMTIKPFTGLEIAHF